MSKRLTLKDLKLFIKAVEKKYGTKKAEKFPIETLRKFVIQGEETAHTPYEIDTMRVATYPDDNETVVIICGGL